jgi:hypothetical protein
VVLPLLARVWRERIKEVRPWAFKAVMWGMVVELFVTLPRYRYDTSDRVRLIYQDKDGNPKLPPLTHWAFNALFPEEEICNAGIIGGAILPEIIPIGGGIMKDFRRDLWQGKLLNFYAPYSNLNWSLNFPMSGTTAQLFREAGVDTLPGAGAEILSERVRKIISPAKPSVRDWIVVMHEAHQLDIPSTATMMYGHIETPHERIDHLITIRDLQARKPEGSRGFTAFIPWVFCPTGTQLEKEGVSPRFSALEYLRIIAMSRIILHNIPNIQASWLTVGKDVAEIALKSGANDMGSIMIEENVVSSAGATTRFDREAMQATIRRAGFTPQLRDQLYNYRELK